MTADATRAIVPATRRRMGWAAPVAMVLTLLTRLPGLTRPDLLVFDEQYWATGAADVLQWGAEHGLAKHPPLGKLLIASGIEAFGFTPLGWRIAALIAGVATVGMVSAAIRRLTGDQRLAFLGGLFCALDGVMFTMGRLGMLDVFVGFFMALVVWLLAMLWTTPVDARRTARWLGVGALFAAGLGGSVKWTMLPVAVVVGAVMLAVDRRSRPAGARRWATVLTLALVVVVPTVTYLATWLPRETGPDPFTPSSFVTFQREVAHFHLTWDARNSNAAPATSWLTMSRPTRLFAQNCASAASRRGVGPCRGASPDSGVLLLALPNPMVWGVCLAGLAGLVVTAIRRRDGLAVWLAGLVATQWGPWLVNRRWAYSFYLTAIIPPMLVGAMYLVRGRRLRTWRLPLGVAAVLTVALFAYFYPVLTGRAMSNQALGDRIWWWSWPD